MYVSARELKETGFSGAMVVEIVLAVVLGQSLFLFFGGSVGGQASFPALFDSEPIDDDNDSSNYANVTDTPTPPLDVASIRVPAQEPLVILVSRDSPSPASSQEDRREKE